MTPRGCATLRRCVMTPRGCAILRRSEPTGPDDMNARPATLWSASRFMPRLLRRRSPPAPAVRPAKSIGNAVGMQIRAATATDWPALWPMLRDNATAGETYTWDPEIDEETARRLWMKEPPGRTVVAVDVDGTVLGSAYTRPNQDRPGSHVANASF